MVIKIKRLTTKSDIQGSIAHRAVYDGFMATTSVETANVGKVFIIRSLRRSEGSGRVGQNEERKKL